MAGLYSSWNNENLTSAQFAEAESKLELFPAASLAKKIDNSNLLSLKKKLYDLKIHKQLMNVLRRKYNLFEEKGVKRSIKDEKTHLDLPDTVQKVIRDSLQEMGKKDDEQVDSYSLLLEQAGDGAESCNAVLNSESLKELSEVELCAKFGLNPDILKKEFSQLFKSILQVFRFLKTGDVETY